MDDDDFDRQLDDLAQTAYRVAYRILGDREEARDISQESLARAYVRWPRVRNKADAWVARVAGNLALDVVRRQRHGSTAAPDRSPDHAEAAAVRDELVALLQTLPRRQRQVVVLRYLADLPEAQVAAALGCSVGSVKRHAHRGLAALRTTIQIDAPAIEPAGGT